MSFNRKGQKFPQKSKSFSGRFNEIDPDAKLLGDKQIEGVCLVTDFEKTRSLQKRIGELIGGPTNFFAGMWPVNLFKGNVDRLKTEPYVVSVKPVGQRLLLYIDPSGNIYLENDSQHIFRVNDDCSLELVPDTILDGIMNPSSSGGKFTFFIQDAMRCNGTDLTKWGIIKRMDFVKSELINPRMEKSKKNINEAFNLDVVEIRELNKAKEFIDDEFENNFKYRVQCLVFFPRNQGYQYSGVTTNHDILQWRYDPTYEGNFRLKITEEPKSKNKQAELHVVGPGMKEICYDTIALTDEIFQYDGCIIACKYIDHQWIFKRVRKDRSHPNGRRTVEGTLESLENPVSRHELIEYLENSYRQN